MKTRRVINNTSALCTVSWQGEAKLASDSKAGELRSLMRAIEREKQAANGLDIRTIIWPEKVILMANVGWVRSERGNSGGESAQAIAANWR